jgi:hypothetical protein
MERCQSTAMTSHRGIQLDKDSRVQPATTVDAKKVKRYNLVLPEELFNELQAEAERRQVTVVELLRKYIKLGLLVNRSLDSPDSSLLIREGNAEKEIVII